MNKLIITLLFIVSLLLVGCEKNTLTGDIQTEKVCECSEIDLSEYDKRLTSLEEQTRTLRKQVGILVNDLYVTKEELNLTKSSQAELEQLNKELEEDIERVDTNIDIQSCIDKGGEWVNNYCKMPTEEQQGIDLNDYPNPF